MAAQQLIASLGPLAAERISRVAPNAVVTLFPSFRIVAPVVFRGRVTAAFLLRSRRVDDARARHRCHVISPSPHFFGQEIPVRESDLTTVIVRRRFARFSHDEASFCTGFCRV
ncbi:hypothetical protein [Burkholderia ambifaria]|uniref:hypothetical protein n=1 Tax=Burkholderia ambifaria TaxID=152480 RepID=UPI00158DB407|nr:hypothetical protein [Burkholderia ambifaria]